VALHRILEQIEESNRWDAEKAEKWKRETELLIDAISSSDDL
jgi:hypothetical protein